MFGAGVLSLPKAFTWSGLAGGVCIYIVVLAMCTYTMCLLIQTLLFVRKRWAPEQVQHINTYRLDVCAQK